LFVLIDYSCFKDLPAFCPAYQGIFLLTAQGKKMIYGWEALLRGPKGSEHESPVNLFAMARDKGRLAEIDLLAFCLSCRCFVANDPGGKLFVNLFPETLACEEFTVQALFRFLKKIGLPPARLVIEIVESAFDLELLENAVREMSAIGIQFALDDFGGGHRDLERWLKFHPAYVKCDRSLIQGISENTRQVHALRLLEGLCATDGTVLLAEGVETQEEIDFLLAETNVGLFQGFYFGYPSPLVGRTVDLEAKERGVQQSLGAGSF
jgi:EAL domain-containing protein (putative c-di-GMP-specific phosphodiesterase class I)